MPSILNELLIICPCFFINSITCSYVVFFGLPSTSSSNSTKSFNSPISSNGPTLFPEKTLSCVSPLLTILSGKSICHKSIWLPSLIICSISSTCFSFNPSNSCSKYPLYLFCISFNTLAYPVSSLSVLFMSGKTPSCLCVQSNIRVNICMSSFSVISLSQFTFIVLFTKSITTGLSSSFVGLSGFSEYITLPNCCKYSIREFSSSGLSHIIPSSLSKCNPSFALFITSINSVSSVLLFLNSSNLLAFSLSPYSPSIEWKLGFIPEPLKYSAICFS